MAKKKRPEVIDLEKRKRRLHGRDRLSHFNIGAIIFLLIFLYMAFYVYAYLTREKVQFYEVAEGSIVEDREYTGLILRGVRLHHRAGRLHQLLYPRGKTGLRGGQRLLPG